MDTIFYGYPLMLAIMGYLIIKLGNAVSSICLLEERIEILDSKLECLQISRQGINSKLAEITKDIDILKSKKG